MLAITFVHELFPVERQSQYNSTETLSMESLRADKVRSVVIHHTTSLPLNFTNIHQGFNLLIFTASPGAEAAAQLKLSGQPQMTETLKCVELIQPPTLAASTLQTMVSTVFKVRTCWWKTNISTKELQFSSNASVLRSVLPSTVPSPKQISLTARPGFHVSTS